MKAVFTLTRIDADQNKYVDSVCEIHAQEWDHYQEGEQIEMEIE